MIQNRGEIESEIEILRNLRKSSVSIDFLNVDISANEIFIETSDEEIFSEGLIKLREFMKERYQAELERLEAGYYTITFVFSIREAN
ncbi:MULTISPECIES: hypothetical protein [Cuniculiplasmataceae]|uniref:hypothetical protein n=1 Tax=unclassified Cuniculiplasma TaxID=2619706 RepID=UPI003FD314F8